jgi:biopolymer transport protein ExbB
METLLQIGALFTKGGLVMYPLIACSVLVLTIAVERFWYYRQATTNLPELLAAIENPMKIGDWQGASTICSEAAGVTAQIMAAGLRQPGCNSNRLERLLEGETGLAIAKLREKLPYLDTIVTLSPLLGLLGTVIGMIGSFSVLNLKTGQPLAITGGVGEALIATATGLCVAALSLLFHSYFTGRLDRLITDMERAGNYLLAEKTQEDQNEVV